MISLGRKRNGSPDPKWTAAEVPGAQVSVHALMMSRTVMPDGIIGSTCSW
jgi:hypothetical protein